MSSYRRALLRKSDSPAVLSERVRALSADSVLSIHFRRTKQIMLNTHNPFMTHKLVAGAKRACLALVAGAFLVACGGAAKLADLPVYTNATELKAGESTIGDTLNKNMAQDKAMREAVGVGGKTEQRGFKLPADATWDQVKAFYTEKLKADGWSEGMGGIGGNLVNNVMSEVNKSNDMVQTALFSKGNQTLTVLRAVNPTNASEVELILSLSTR